MLQISAGRGLGN